MLPGAGLVHRRLAVLDPEPRSNQPFGDRRRWLVFNGEIYNFRELRSQIGGREWKTTGDTEVLLAAYGEWGERCVDHLNGMYAFAVWDEREQSLFLARDRMGQKPLYFAVSRNGDGIGALAFASEIGALLNVEWVHRGMDRESLVEYLRWGYVAGAGTFYLGIGQLMPGQTARVTSKGILFGSHAQNPHPGPPPGYRERGQEGGDAVGLTRGFVEQAVRRQLVTDVPLGCFLSGGVDSSIMAAAMKAAGGVNGRVLTFSIGFDEAEYDETPFAAEVAAYLGTEHRQLIMRPDAAEDLPRIAAAFGEPMADSSALPTYHLARFARQHIKVALSGDGGDELFGGYDRYRAMRLMQRTGQWPWRLARRLMNLAPGTDPKRLPARLKRLVDSAALPHATAYSHIMRMFDESLIGSLMVSPPMVRGADWIEQEFEMESKGRELAMAAMAVDRRTYLPGDLLTKVDRCSMAFALEVRSPFMDHELVAFAAGLEAGVVMSGGIKPLLRHAFAADLPAAVFKRRKMGFAVPIGRWLRTSLRGMLNDLVFASDSFAGEYFRKETIETMIAEHQEERRDHSQRLYALMMLELWKRKSS